MEIQSYVILILSLVVCFVVNPFIIYKIIDGCGKRDLLRAYKYASIVFIVNCGVAGILMLLGEVK